MLKRFIYVLELLSRLEHVLAAAAAVAEAIPARVQRCSSCALTSVQHHACALLQQ
jgi:hypothetical protein